MSKSDDSNKPTEPVSDGVSLASMRAGQEGTIVAIDGGHGLAHKLEAIGIREGRKIKKISEQWMKGV